MAMMIRAVTLIMLCNEDGDDHACGVDCAGDAGG